MHVRLFRAFFGSFQATSPVIFQHPPSAPPVVTDATRRCRRETPSSPSNPTQPQAAKNQQHPLNRLGQLTGRLTRDCIAKFGDCPETSNRPIRKLQTPQTPAEMTTATVGAVRPPSELAIREAADHGGTQSEMIRTRSSATEQPQRRHNDKPIRSPQAPCRASRAC